MKKGSGKPSRDLYAENHAEEMEKIRKKYNVNPRGFYLGGRKVSINV